MMGLLKPQVEYFVKTCAENNITGSILTFGKMDIFISFEDFKLILVKHGVAHYTNDNNVELNDKICNDRFHGLINSHKAFRDGLGLTSTNVITDTLLYTALGFADIEYIDIVPNLASIVYDLNQPGITSVISKKYDLVLDGGVMEHVFDVRHVFLNATDIVKNDGYIIHILPGNNTFEHGFYQFSPTLFNDYYSANRYDIINNITLELSVDRFCTSNCFCDKWNSYRFIQYDPYFFGKNSFGQLGNEIYFVMMCARKNENSLRDIMPGQYAFSGKSVLLPW